MADNIPDIEDIRETFDKIMADIGNLKISIVNKLTPVVFESVGMVKAELSKQIDNKIKRLTDTLIADFKTDLKKHSGATQQTHTEALKKVSTLR